MYPYLSEHFSYDEFVESSTARKFGIRNVADSGTQRCIKYLVDKVLEPLREQIGKPIYINSGYRCRELNAAVCGSSTSRHLQGLAADLRCSSRSQALDLYQRLILTPDISQYLDECFVEKLGKVRWLHVSAALPENARHHYKFDYPATKK